jgi:hypothetical protein
MGGKAESTSLLRAGNETEKIYIYGDEQDTYGGKTHLSDAHADAEVAIRHGFVRKARDLPAHDRCARAPYGRNELIAIMHARTSTHATAARPQVLGIVFVQLLITAAIVFPCVTSVPVKLFLATQGWFIILVLVLYVVFSCALACCAPPPSY